MVISSLPVISIIDIRDRYWYHLYQLSVYMYICIYIYRVSVWVSASCLRGIDIRMDSAVEAIALVSPRCRSPHEEVRPR